MRILQGRGYIWQNILQRRIAYLRKSGLDTRQISWAMSLYKSTIELLSVCDYRVGQSCIDHECLHLRIEHLRESGLDTQGVFETLKDTLSADKIWNFQQPSEIESWHSSISGTPDFVEYLRTTELDMQQITEDLELQPSTIEWLSSSTSVPDIEKSLDTGSTAPLSDLRKLEKQQKDAEKNQKQILRRSVTLIIVLWFIIDSSARGLIYPSLFEISWIDMAGANCSVLDNLGYDLQSQCETAKSQAQAVVGFCIFALLYNIAELLRLLRT